MTFEHNSTRPTFELTDGRRHRLLLALGEHGRSASDVRS